MQKSGGRFFFTSLSDNDLDRIGIIDGAAQTTPWSNHSLEAELASSHAFCFGAGCVGDAAISAFILCRLLLRELHLHNLCTLPRRQRQGLATALLHHTLVLAQTRGAQTAFLEVRSLNRSALRIYEKCGFVVDRIRQAYYTDGDDALVMSRAL
ncbi:MAG: GNAT family N-acetyltransferase [Chitinispirillaceae bacterium]|nr:GNAT family N-acetyltransferase [Chitinispirillaceae bacterium]